MGNGWRALYVLELRRTLRDPLTWIGLFAFTAILGLGAVLYWRALPPRPESGRLFGEAFLLAAIIAWHSGFARDRGVRFDTYLVANFMQPAQVYFAKVAAAFTVMLSFSLLALLLATAASAGDVGYAARTAGSLFLVSVLALPALVLIELVLNTRYPVPILILLFLAFLAIYNRIGDVQALSRALGMDGKLAPGPVLLRSAVALALTAALYGVFRLRLGGPRLAALVDSP